MKETKIFLRKSSIKLLAAAYVLLFSVCMLLPLVLSDNTKNRDIMLRFDSYSAADTASLDYSISDSLLILKSESSQLPTMQQPTISDKLTMISQNKAEEPKEDTILTQKKAETVQDQTENVQESTPVITEQTVHGFSQLTVYNTSTEQNLIIPLEEYVLSVLLAEMPSSYGIEALKAQAIACRTYAVYKASGGAHASGADICTSSAHCQAFAQLSDISQDSDKYKKAKEAVDSTKGVIMMYDSAPILAAYHSSSYGVTSSSAEVWGGDRAYLQSVQSFESSIPTLSVDKTYTFTSDEFMQRISSLNSALSTFSYGEASQCLSQNLTSSGRCHSVLVGDVKISASAFVSSFGLRSRKFDIAFYDNSVTITTHGYGHGVGLSQMGAEYLAQQGYTSYEILSHYYTGVSYGTVA